ncbi:MAG: HEPN domain-containing protein [Oscillospiraceae bacterium]|nr:HEPN domain-containing protein [Oscillospiraceae bacterium]
MSEVDYNLNEKKQTSPALNGLTEEEKAIIKHREEAEEWMLYAEGDCAAAHHLYEGFFHPKKLEIICYHCSQAAEKATKAVLADLGSPGGMPLKHDIGFILNQMKNILPKEKGIKITEELLDMADELSDYSVDVRYPNQISIDEYTTKKAIEKMDFFIAWAKEALTK